MKDTFASFQIGKLPVHATSQRAQYPLINHRDPWGGGGGRGTMMLSYLLPHEEIVRVCS